jgi:hypothetical protein
MILLCVWATATVGATRREQVWGREKICGVVPVACRQRLDLKFFGASDERWRIELESDFGLRAGAVAGETLVTRELLRRPCGRRDPACDTGEHQRSPPEGRRWGV